MSAMTAGPSARREARPSSLSRAHAPGLTMREKNRSASSAGSSANSGQPGPPAAPDSEAADGAAPDGRSRRNPNHGMGGS